MVNLSSGSSLSTTIPAGTRDVLVTGWVNVLQNTNAGAITYRVKDGGAGGGAATTSSANLSVAIITVAAAGRSFLDLFGIVSAPAAGTRQFGLSLRTSSGTVDVEGTAVGQGYLSVTLI